MDFDQHVHAVVDRRVLDVLGGGIVERRHDDQDAVGAVGAGLDHLIGIEHEILAQHRQICRRARRHHEIQMALERRRIRQHRKTRRAAGLIGSCQRRRIEIGADQSLRGRSLLHLGNQRIIAVRQLFPDRTHEAARRRGGPGAGLDVCKRMRAFGAGDLLALVSLDLAQDVRHRKTFSRWRSRPDVSAGPLPHRYRAIWFRARRLPSNPWHGRRRSAPPRHSTGRHREKRSACR